MSTQANIDKLTEVFRRLPSWEDKYRQIITFGKELPKMDAECQIDKFRILGCQSQVWLHPTLVGGKVYFTADSDALLVKGIISILVNVFSGQSPTEILNCSVDFLNDLGIHQHLSMNRSNGLTSMIKQIKMYAFAYQSLEKGS